MSRKMTILVPERKSECDSIHCGGSWQGVQAYAQVTNRIGNKTDIRFINLGFRLLVWETPCPGG